MVYHGDNYGRKLISPLSCATIIINSLWKKLHACYWFACILIKMLERCRLIIFVTCTFRIYFYSFISMLVQTSVFIAKNDFNFLFLVNFGEIERASMILYHRIACAQFKSQNQCWKPKKKKNWWNPHYFTDKQKFARNSGESIEWFSKATKLILWADNLIPFQVVSRCVFFFGFVHVSKLKRKQI